MPLAAHDKRSQRSSDNEESGEHQLRGSLALGREMPSNGSFFQPLRKIIIFFYLLDEVFEALTTPGIRSQTQMVIFVLVI